MARTYPKGKEPKMATKFAEGGRVPSARDADPTKRDLEDSAQDLENNMLLESNRRSNYAKRGEKKFVDDGSTIPGWQGGKNDEYRERQGYKRLRDNKTGEF